MWLNPTHILGTTCFPCLTENSFLRKNLTQFLRRSLWFDVCLVQLFASTSVVFVPRILQHIQTIIWIITIVLHWLKPFTLVGNLSDRAVKSQVSSLVSGYAFDYHRFESAQTDLQEYLRPDTKSIACFSFYSQSALSILEPRCRMLIY